MFKKILTALLLLVLLAIAVFFIWRYINYLRDTNPNKTFLLPRIELSVFEITSLTSEKTEMNTNVLVMNVMPFAFTADSIEYSLFMNDVEIMKSSYKKSIILKSNDSSWISLPVTLYNHDIDSAIKSNERKNEDSANYRLEASFYTDIVFKKKFDISINRYLPLVHIPTVKVDHMAIDSLNFSRAVIQLHTTVSNKNVFALKSKDYTYEFSIEDNEWIKGIIPGIIDIKADTITEIIIPVTLSLKEVRHTLFDLLKNGSNVKYHLILRFKAVADLNSIKDSKVILESTGTVKSLMKLKNKK